MTSTAKNPPNSESADPFSELESLADNPSAMIETLVKIYRRQQMPHELFEALKMRTRLKLGLPVLGEPTATHPEDIERQLEHGLLDACREVGAMLIRSGRIREGWVYFRPTGDTAAAAKLIHGIEIDDENIDDIIQVALHEGVDTGLGYELLLKRNGTCNSITSFDQLLAGRHRDDQQVAAKLLLDHVYAELLNSLRFDIERREEKRPTGETVTEIIDPRPTLLEGGGYHLDTTHLSAVIRIARVLEDREDLAKALEFVRYGQRLNAQFQYPGDEPFVDFYPAHALFYEALLGQHVDQALSYFERKAASVDVHQHGTAAIEVYVDLLDRLGQHAKALDAAVRMMPAEIPATRVAPLLIELTERSGDTQPLKEFARRRGDLLVYAAALSMSRAD